MTKTNLAAFRSTGVQTPSEQTKVLEKPKGLLRGITIRLTRDQWRRVKDLSTADETSIQALVLAGLSKLFADRGLPPL